ncbi:MAG: dihydroneopterin aldolase [Micropruina sp.]|uniref:dihydroneopterin aldolase n=1 Tax=Micropruina sp. TaxID=2737536 RepID=UPI0039E576A8
MAQSTPDRVRLTGMRFRTTHGVYDFERVEPQDFVIDVSCELAPRPASDDLATTVDYAELSRAIAADVCGEPVNLIETLAERVAATCLSRPPVAAVEVTVHKPEARMPVELADVAVTITRRRTS